jgi:hypothetical protein
MVSNESSIYLSWLFSHSRSTQRIMNDVALSWMENYDELMTLRSLRRVTGYCISRPLFACVFPIVSYIGIDSWFVIFY